MPNYGRRNGTTLIYLVDFRGILVRAVYTAGLRLETTAHTVDTSLPVQQWQDPVQAAYDRFETRDYSTHSGYFTSGSAVFKIRYEQSTAGLRLEITAYTADISLPVQQCSRSSTSSL